MKCNYCSNIGEFSYDFNLSLCGLHWNKIYFSKAPDYIPKIQKNVYKVKFYEKILTERNTENDSIRRNKFNESY